jgi:hypothetical protein
MLPGAIATEKHKAIAEALLNWGKSVGKPVMDSEHPLDTISEGIGKSALGFANMVQTGVRGTGAMLHDLAQPGADEGLGATINRAFEAGKKEMDRPERQIENLAPPVAGKDPEDPHAEAFAGALMKPFDAIQGVGNTAGEYGQDAVEWGRGKLRDKTGYDIGSVPGSLVGTAISTAPAAADDLAAAAPLVAGKLKALRGSKLPEGTYARGMGPRKFHPDPELDFREQTSAHGVGREPGTTLGAEDPGFTLVAPEGSGKVGKTLDGRIEALRGANSSLPGGLLSAQDVGAAMRQPWVDPKGKSKPAERSQQMDRLPHLLHEAPVDEGIAFARAGGHLMPREEGGYIGGPKGIKGPEDLAKVEENTWNQNKATLETGQRLAESDGAGGDWYEQQKKLLEELYPGQELKGAKGLGVYSPQADPNTNLGWTLANDRALAGSDPATAPHIEKWDALRSSLGDDTSAIPARLEALTKEGMAKTGKQADTFDNVFLHPDEPMPGGIKVGQFTEDQAGNVPGRSLPTNDLHGGRQNGFGSGWSQGFSHAQQGWLSGQLLKFMDRLRESGIPGPGPGGKWTEIKQPQALEWATSRMIGYMKDRFPGVPITDIGKLPLDAQRAIFEYGRKGFNDYVPNMTGSMMHEDVPALTSGHRPDVLAGDRAKKDAYTAALRKEGGTVQGPGGTYNPVLKDLEWTQRYQTEGEGSFVPQHGGPTEYNGVTVSHPTMTFAKGSKDQLSPQHAKDLALALHTQGMIGVQEGVPGHVLKQSGSNSGNALQLSGVTDPTEVQALMKAVEGAVDQEGKPMLGLTNSDKAKGEFSLTTQNQDGVWGKGSSNDLTKGLQGLDPWLSDGLAQKQSTGKGRGETQRMGYVGDYGYIPWGTAKPGGLSEAYIQRLRESRPEAVGLLQKNDAAKKQALGANRVDEAAAKEGAQVNSEVMKWRKMYGELGPVGMTQKVVEQAKKMGLDPKNRQSLVAAAAKMGLPAVIIQQLFSGQED